MIAALEAKIQQISGVTIAEWVTIRATLQSLEDEKFNCQKCQAKYRSRPDGEQMLERVRANMGCREMKAQPIHKIGEEIRFRSCIGNYVSHQVFQLLSAHNRFSQGVMPYAGGLMDQPAKIIEIFEVIDSHRAERAERERMKERLMARGARGGR